MTPDELSAKVAATRARQGLPPKIENPATLERVAAIFRLVEQQSRAPVPRRRRRGASREATPA